MILYNYLLDLHVEGQNYRIHNYYAIFDLFRELQASAREALEKLAITEAKATTMQSGRTHNMQW